MIQETRASLEYRNGELSKRRPLVRVTEVEQIAQRDMVCGSPVACRLRLGHDRLHGPIAEERAIDLSRFKVTSGQPCSVAAVLGDAVISCPTLACSRAGKDS